MLKQVLEARRAEILEVAAKYGAGNIRVFGSVARGEDTPESDIDLLVHFDANRSLFDHVGLMQDLGDLLGRKIQITTDRALHPFIRAGILGQAVPL